MNTPSERVAQLHRDYPKRYARQAAALVIPDEDKIAQGTCIAACDHHAIALLYLDRYARGFSEGTKQALYNLLISLSARLYVVLSVDKPLLREYEALICDLHRIGDAYAKEHSQ